MPAAGVARANEAGGNSGAERGAGPKPSRWSAARRRPGCAGRPTLRKRGVARLRARQDKGYRLPALRHPLDWGSEAETRKEKEREPGHECPGNEETEGTNFVGWVERCARNPSSWQGPAMDVAVAQPILRREARETRKNPGAATRAGTKKTALFDIVNRERRGAMHRQGAGAPSRR